MLTFDVWHVDEVFSSWADGKGCVRRCVGEQFADVNVVV